MVNLRGRRVAGYKVAHYRPLRFAPSGDKIARQDQFKGDRHESDFAGVPCFAP